MGSSMRKKKEKKKDFQVCEFSIFCAQLRIYRRMLLTEPITETKIEGWEDQS